MTPRFKVVLAIAFSLVALSYDARADPLSRYCAEDERCCEWD